MVSLLATAGKEPLMANDSERFREWDRRQLAGEVGRPETIGRPDLRTELVPWDDADFVREYEGAHEQVVREGLLINGPRAAARLEELMRAAGYPHVSVKVERTIDEALRHAARWTVRRDGEPAPDQE